MKEWRTNSKETNQATEQRKLELSSIIAHYRSFMEAMIEYDKLSEISSSIARKGLQEPHI